MMTTATAAGVDALALVNLLPVMERTSGRPEIVVGLLDGPVATGLSALAAENVQQAAGSPGGGGVLLAGWICLLAWHFCGWDTQRTEVLVPGRRLPGLHLVGPPDLSGIVGRDTTAGYHTPPTTQKQDQQTGRTRLTTR
jgi:hypothetical protein